MPEENPRRRRSYASTIIAVIVVLALGFGCYWAWKIFSGGVEPIPEPVPVEQTQPVVDPTVAYTSPSMGISVRYPRDFTVNEEYSYLGVSEDKPIAGVQFTIPALLAAGTNLSSDSYLSVEQLPTANTCRGDYYLAAFVTPVEVEEGGVSYLLASSTEETDDGVYEEWVYGLEGSTPCTAVRYFIHSTDLEMHATGTRAFDRASLMAEFDRIRQTLVLQ